MSQFGATACTEFTHSDPASTMAVLQAPMLPKRTPIRFAGYFSAPFQRALGQIPDVTLDQVGKFSSEKGPANGVARWAPHRDNTVAVAQASHDLGVHQSQLRDWVKKFSDDSRRPWQMKPEQLEIARLRREVAKLKAERDILKKAAASADHAL